MVKIHFHRYQRNPWDHVSFLAVWQASDITGNIWVTKIQPAEQRRWSWFLNQQLRGKIKENQSNKHFGWHIDFNWPPPTIRFVKPVSYLVIFFLKKGCICLYVGRCGPGQGPLSLASQIWTRLSHRGSTFHCSWNLYSLCEIAKRKSTAATLSVLARLNETYFKAICSHLLLAWLRSTSVPPAGSPAVGPSCHSARRRDTATTAIVVLRLSRSKNVCLRETRNWYIEDIFPSTGI